ncbi:MAG TPA: helix-turn-helix domain-containing protein [Candidatus Limnocylindria bacterium]|nr:helix-turn-helix domain-containing protein [Candidatus Limnocylindria bacterium]
MATSVAETGDVRREHERRRELAAFLSGKRQRVDPRALFVGTYPRRECRVGRPFTQEEAAEALGVSRQWYAALEMGASVRPSTALVDRIATVFALRDDERLTLYSLAIREFAFCLNAKATILDGPSPKTAYAAAIESPGQIQDAAQQLARAREQYVLSGAAIGTQARSRIVESWERCRELGVDPGLKRAPLYDDLAVRRAANERLLAAADPVLKHLADEFVGTGYVVVITDAAGRLLDVAGDLDARRRLARIEFEPGADWSEAAAGTNAIGTALADRRPLQLLAAEHFCDAPQPFTCTAAPICAPTTREIVGVLDFTGSYQLVRPHLVGVVMQSALEIEERLALL